MIQYIIIPINHLYTSTLICLNLHTDKLIPDYCHIVILFNAILLYLKFSSNFGADRDSVGLNKTFFIFQSDSGQYDKKQEYIFSPCPRERHADPLPSLQKWPKAKEMRKKVKQIHYGLILLSFANLVGV